MEPHSRADSCPCLTLQQANNRALDSYAGHICSAESRQAGLASRQTDSSVQSTIKQACRLCHCSLPTYCRAVAQQRVKRACPQQPHAHKAGHPCTTCEENALQICICCEATDGILICWQPAEGLSKQADQSSPTGGRTLVGLRSCAASNSELSYAMATAAQSLIIYNSLLK